MAASVCQKLPRVLQSSYGRDKREANCPHYPGCRRTSRGGDVDGLAGIIQPGPGEPGDPRTDREGRGRAQLRPQFTGSGLSSGRTNAIALLVPDVTNPFYFDIIRGTQNQLKAAGYTQLLVDTEESAEMEADTLRKMQRTADGVILAASRLTDAQILEAASSRCHRDRQQILLQRAHGGD